jgi:hypothetical protein
LTSSKNALRKLLKKLGMEGALELGRIAEKWGALFNGPLAVHTSPESLSGKILTVNVDSPSWLHQAGFFRSQMLSKLRVYGVASIRFRQGTVRVRETPTFSKRTEPEINPQAIEDVERMLGAIDDHELRESIRGAALRCLSSGGRGDGIGKAS